MPPNLGGVSADWLVLLVIFLAWYCKKQCREGKQLSSASQKKKTWGCMAGKKILDKLEEAPFLAAF